MTTTYHSLTDKQVERSNQSIEIFLRCLLIDKYEIKWNEFLFHIEYALNIVLNVFTEIFSFQVLYDVQFRNLLFMIVQKDFNQEEMNFLKKRRWLKIDVIDVIKLTQVKMTIQFDKKHWLSNLQNKIYVKLIKKNQMKYHVSLSSFLTIKKLKSYSIKRKISHLIYETDLSFIMKTHFVILMIYLKQIKKNAFDRNSFQKISRSILMNDHEKYVVKKIVRIEIRDNVSNYIVKWKKYTKKTWELENRLRADVFDMIDKFHWTCRDRNHWDYTNWDNEWISRRSYFTTRAHLRFVYLNNWAIANLKLTSFSLRWLISYLYQHFRIFSWHSFITYCQSSYYSSAFHLVRNDVFINKSDDDLKERRRSQWVWR